MDETLPGRFRRIDRYAMNSLSSQRDQAFGSDVASRFWEGDSVSS